MCSVPSSVPAIQAAGAKLQPVPLKDPGALLSLIYFGVSRCNILLQNVQP